MTPLRQRVARILVQPSHATRLGLLSLFVHPFFALDERYGSVVPASSSPLVAQLRLVFLQWTTCFWWTLSGRRHFANFESKYVFLWLLLPLFFSFLSFSSFHSLWLMRWYKYFVYIVQSRFVYVFGKLLVDDIRINKWKHHNAIIH